MTTTNKAATPKVGGTYRVYGKMGDMKRFMAMSGSEFTDKLIFAEVFHIDSEDKLEKFNRELKYLNTQGTFEARRIPKSV